MQTFQLTDVLDPNAFKVTELTTIAEDSDALEDSQSSSEDDDTEMVSDGDEMYPADGFTFRFCVCRMTLRRR